LRGIQIVTAFAEQNRGHRIADNIAYQSDFKLAVVGTAHEPNLLFYRKLPRNLVRPIELWPLGGRHQGKAFQLNILESVRAHVLINFITSAPDIAGHGKVGSDQAYSPGIRGRIFRSNPSAIPIWQERRE